MTGSASGIGKATASLLRAAGHKVIGIDLRDAEIIADLSLKSARDSLVEKVHALSPGGIDGILAIAGGPAEVNYLGAVATLDGLRPLLADSPAPRAVAVSSFAAALEVDEALLEAYLSGDETVIAEESAAAAKDGREQFLYATSKRAVSLWVRRQSITAEWAGAGIPINAVAPGVIRTPMTEEILSTPEGHAMLLGMVPAPLNGPAEPEVPARLLAWLVSEENSHVTGQVIFLDGGADATVRGDSIF
ncbi:short-chain dehydrogenase [Microbacterium sp. Root61]|uniref:SDR family oxidoreductase n=1 Tax=Microbacterium sp. Root61 TaxID=1736570 RepID=UPI0006FE0657|nr:SDR family oxidoreductase [Microbacterium sp. Root61]KRA23004.1 short-chain dehydrogenase [Microbacterium sp. Root61]